MSDHSSSAIVLGASMGGLLAARALSGTFKHVTIVERDVLPGNAELRQGVPQAAHAHGLLASGYRVMDAYFPGLMKELQSLGAINGDVVGDFLWFQYGRWKLRHKSGLGGIVVSRPCLEGAIRRAVRAIPNIAFLEGTSAVKPVFDQSAGRVTGLMVRPRTGADEMMAADLVVDATGRGSQSPKWLEEWGFGSPEVLQVKVDVGYATRVFERRPGDFFNSMGGIISGTPPIHRRLAAVLAAEGPRWVVTLAGVLGDHPPMDEQGWTSFAASLPVPCVHELVSTAQPIGSIATYRFPANRRVLYERMARFPEGYLITGDAVCSFNPIYGQGMSTAALDAKALEESLSTGSQGLASRFFNRVSKLVDIPWTIATGEDLRYPEVEGKRPPGFTLVNRYLERVHAIASADEIVLPSLLRRPELAGAASVIDGTTGRVACPGTSGSERSRHAVGTDRATGRRPRGSTAGHFLTGRSIDDSQPPLPRYPCQSSAPGDASAATITRRAPTISLLEMARGKTPSDS